VFSDAAIRFCLTIKVLFKLALRQTTGMVASLLKMANLDWAVPDHTTLCRRQKTFRSPIGVPTGRSTCWWTSSRQAPPVRANRRGCIKFLGDGEWQARKHGIQGRRQLLPGRGLQSNRPRGRARCIWPWTPRLRTSGRWNLPPAATVTALCCQNCSTRTARPDPRGRRNRHGDGGRCL